MQPREELTTTAGRMPERFLPVHLIFRIVATQNPPPLMPHLTITVAVTFCVAPPFSVSATGIV
jgi:hypothetical protein